MALPRTKTRLKALRTNLKLQVYSVLAKEGVHVPMTDLFGVAGRKLLETAKLAPAYAARVESLLDLIESFDRQVAIFERDVERQLRDDAGYRAMAESIDPRELLGELLGAAPAIADANDPHLPVP